MKMKKIIVALLAILAIIAGLPVSAAQRELTFERAVQINDTQIVLEFSEPVAVNIHGNNRGPYVAIRLVNGLGGGTLFDKTTDKDPLYKKNLQWPGMLQYLDEKHDRLLWTMTSGGTSFGVTTINDIVNYKGVLADYSDRRVAIVIEEVPFDETKVTANDAIDNITTEDGEVYLTPTYPAGWERVTAPFTVNYSYPADLNKVQSTELFASSDTYAVPILEPGDITDLEDNKNSVVRVLKNNTIITAAILGGGALLCVAMIVTSLIVRKKRRA